MNKQKLMVLVAFSCLLGVAVIIGCTTVGQGFLIPAGGVEAKFAFVVNGSADGSATPTINVYKVDPTTGALTQVVTAFDAGLASSSSAGVATVFIDADPTSRFIYVPLPEQGKIAVFSVDQSSGALAAVPGSPFASTAGNPYSAKLNPAGTVLYVTNYNDNTISTFSVDSAGKLTQIPPDLPLSSDPHLVVMDPKGRFLYVPNENGQFNGFTISPSNGALTAMNNGIPFDADNYSTGGTVDASGQFLLVANKYACDPGTVSVYKIDQNSGVPTEVTGEGSPFATTTGANDCGPYTVVEFMVGGQAYVAANNYNGTSNVAVFSLDTTSGKLKAVGGSPFVFNNWQWLHYIAVDPSGKFGYAVDFGTDCCDTGPSTITGVTIDSNGNLTQIPGSPFSNGTNAPTQIIITH
ncbi:MAG: lactonase family protein [Acidobacteriia bacterium]|nr:lactonase family protein [Terriglobia bacterium]